MNILAVQRLALRGASDERLRLHMHRLDNIACLWGRGENGYGNPRLNKAEQNRVDEVRRRRGMLSQAPFQEEA